MPVTDNHDQVVARAIPDNDHSPLDTVPTGFIVYQCRPLNTLARWRQLIVRVAFFVTQYHTGVESQAICTTKEQAIEMCVHDGYYIHELPINMLLPDEECQWRPTLFPRSEERDRYLEYEPTMRAVKANELDHGLRQVVRSVDNMKGILTAPDSALN